jgi:GTP-binding protein HflX
VQSCPARSTPEEFVDLAIAAGVTVAKKVTGKRAFPNSKYFVGLGKLKELETLISECSADVIIFNNSLTPSQERDLEAALSCRVLDKTGLILDIFAQRALTHEGKLQVELAQLQHLSTRLIRGWTHLKRQKGGIGMRGPGETQLESDRRLVRNRIAVLEKKLLKVANQRAQGRNRRQKSGTPLVSLVGYTNAGKSSIFNQITSSDVLAKDMLFSTLDPTLRVKSLYDFGDVIFSDTVGFIRDLPHGLVEAFNSTLEEVSSADLILHIIDLSKEDYYEDIIQVRSVLKEINASDVPSIFVYNKSDLLDDPKAGIQRNKKGVPEGITISAKCQRDIEMLKNIVSERLSLKHITTNVRLGICDLFLRSAFYNINCVLSEKSFDDGSLELTVRLPQFRLNSIMKKSRTK